MENKQNKNINTLKAASYENLETFKPDFECTLKKEYIKAIKSGYKTFEGRIASDFFKDYKPGKIIRWYCNDDSVITKIVSRNTYQSFEEMLQDIGYKKFLPNSYSLDHAISLYHKIPGYSEKVKKRGALAIELCLVKEKSSSNTDYFCDDQSAKVCKKVKL